MTDHPTPPAPTPPAPRRRFPARALVAVLVLGVTGTGVGLTAVRVADADRTAPTVVWKKPRPDKERHGQQHRAGDTAALSDRLLPVPDGFVPGPDIEEFGNDAVLTGRRATAILKDSTRGLPARRRKQHAEAVDELRIQGMAVRSYQSSDSVVEMKVVQLRNTRAVRDLGRFQDTFMKMLDVFRKGPRIEGHRTAHCYLMPKTKAKLDRMVCNAYEDDLMVNMDAYGARPLDTEEAARLLEKQLDHLTSPGEYV
ncbi:hypothetical protein [Streptomyces meridianus]|uniref:Secreted protein n=1 Tax=Streptomyces meridianus TaxID=2938945 RepID=A0ABT0X6I7_9ACTN|nr:hypothetical protein [Streptomyces meridianus]MCM2577307.1 hypothetical protein [Streptomyces meridianus]